ncbi:MFS transporter [Sphingobium naphthae]|uniref:MFS transporter n=1 Tax=Sphingobium naphthae TaxID=1886786 RepID=A0ABU3ZZH3_9SPHN|nr:MFS transporter [Sphingobium naphthae]MDV5824931.1 MFS transporter [Sphingobium naphthae]
MSLIVAIAFFMETLDATIIVTAIPQMALDFGTDASRLSMGITVYLMAAAGCVTASGWLADRLGTRTLFCSALGLFAISSLICGLAPNFPTFVIGRALQGASASMMSPVGRLVVLRTSEKKHLMKSLSALIWPGLIAPVLGPPLGGWITDTASWHWIFFVNIPIAALAMLLVARYIPNETRETGAFDGKGFILTAAALLCLTSGLDLLAMRDFSLLQLGILLLAIASVLGWAALRHMRTVERPLVQLDALKVPSFFASSVTGGILSRATISATPFLLPLMFQLAFGLSALEAGGMLMLYMLANLAMKSVTNPIITRLGLRATLVSGSLLAGASIALCGFIVPGQHILFNGAVLLLAGCARSLQLTSVTMVNFADITPDQRQPASVLASLTQQIGMGAGVAIGALLLTLSQMTHKAPAFELIDFRLALGITGLLSASAAIFYIRLDPDVGDEVSGHARYRRRISP